MRAHEFITEGKRNNKRSAARHEFEMAHPGLVGPGGSGDVYWGRYYDFYRVCSLAGMDPKELDKVDDIGFFGNLPLFSTMILNEYSASTNLPRTSALATILILIMVLTLVIGSYFSQTES
jgi:hypothetical protein